MKKRDYLGKQHSFGRLYAPVFNLPITLFPRTDNIVEFSLNKSFGCVSDAFCKAGNSITKALKDAEVLYGKR